MDKKKIILITGASSGIGLDTAKLLASRGYTVYGAARRVEQIEALQNPNIIGVHIDVTDEDSIRAGVKSIIAREGRIDVLINNAGYGSFGAVEEVPIQEAERQLQVNVLGAMRIVKLVLPYMRAQGGGRIINTSSVGGRMTLYFGGWYHASKFAIEALSDALRMELKQFGIDVVLIEPGGIKTDWGIIAADHLKTTSQSTPYHKEAVKFADGLEKAYKSNILSSPNTVAKAMLKAVESRRPKARYLCGFGARTLVALHTVLPARQFDWIMMNFMRCIKFLKI